MRNVKGCCNINEKYFCTSNLILKMGCYILRYVVYSILCTNVKEYINVRRLWEYEVQK